VTQCILNGKNRQAAGEAQNQEGPASRTLHTSGRLQASGVKCTETGRSRKKTYRTEKATGWRKRNGKAELSERSQRPGLAAAGMEKSGCKSTRLVKNSQDGHCAASRSEDEI
jgi:hypothetical protein